MPVHSLASFHGSGIWCCCELWGSLQTWLGFRVVVTVAVVSSRSSDSTPSPGTSICCRYGPKKQTTNKHTNATDSDFRASSWGPSSSVHHPDYPCPSSLSIHLPSPTSCPFIRHQPLVSGTVTTALQRLPQCVKVNPSNKSLKCGYILSQRKIRDKS